MKNRCAFFLFLCSAFLCAAALAADDGTQAGGKDAAAKDPAEKPPAAKEEAASAAGSVSGAAVSGEGPRQPGEEFFSELKQVLSMNIAARVSESGEEAVWRVESSKCTVPGRSVSVKIVGKNIVILADFTPYVDADSSIVLVAQGHVWISPDGGEPLKYLSALKSIPVRMGEKVLFFPLGVKSVEAASDTIYNIELEIEVLPGAAGKKERGSP
jgi:hypothetical protein